MTGLSEERAENLTLIRDSATAIVGEPKSFGRIREQRFTDPGFDRSIWSLAAELGWLGLLVPEAEGGAGMGVLELIAISEELGRGLVPEPLPAAIVTMPLLPDDWRAQAMSGEKIVLPVWSANLEGDGARFVPMGVGADAFLADHGNGVALYRADKGATQADGTQDGGHFARFALVEPTGVQPGTGMARAREQATLANVAYLLGTCETAFELTLDYLRVRSQFGRVIGGFQALQHRAVDLRVALGVGRAVLDEAALELDADQDEEPSRATLMAVSRAKACMSETAMLIARECTQFHGAIGITDEHDVSLCTRKILTLNNQFGTAGQHRRRYFKLLRHSAA